MLSMKLHDLFGKASWKEALMIMLLTGAVITTIYCHAVLKTNTIFSHFFYVPIILAAIWYKRKGIFVALFLAANLILSRLILMPDGSILDDLIRSIFFLIVATVLAVISEKLELSHHQVEELSLMDPLTGLHNRRGFFALAEQQMKTAERTRKGLLLIFADLDGMKWINDNLGHKKGDEALIEFANILKETFREADTTARIGGDEFVALAMESSSADSHILKDRLQHQIDIHNAMENRKYHISLSIGMAVYEPENPISIDELMARADKEMYKQKKDKQS